MLLTSLETIKKISRNCLDVGFINGDIYFKRFTEQQYEVYKNVNDALRVRSICPSGTCFDFYTDSEFIRFKYSIKGKSRDWMCFDIYLEDVFVHSISQNPVVNTEGEFDYCIPGEKGKIKRLTIYLPHLIEITLSDIELSDNAHIEEAKINEKSILCLGDSITQGMNALHPSSAYPVQLARYFGMNLLNHGVGGYIFNKCSLDEELQYSPDVITVAYGTNDWNKYSTIEEYSKNVKEFMDKLTVIYPKARIYVLTPIWRYDIDEVKTMGAFDCLGDVINSICSGYKNIQVIDGLSLVPHMTSYYGDIGTHPNDEGFLHYAMGLIKNLSK